MRAAEQVGRPYLIGIAGPSGSGKTELSRRLAAILPAEIVAVDAYDRVAQEDRVCFERRLARDVRERGRSPESVFHQYVATVHPMAERYVLPTRSHADVVVSGADPLERSAALRARAHRGRAIAAREP